MSEIPVSGATPDEPTEPVSRRTFVKVTVGGACLAYAGAIGYPVYRYLNSPVERAQATSAVETVTLEKADALPAGSAMMFKFGTNPAMLIHHADDTWVAFDAVCTHLGCTVEFQPDKNRIHCACHDGNYDAVSGDVTSGPPPKGLMKYAVKVQAGSVLVSKS